MDDFLIKLRKQRAIYWRWYGSLTPEQRREHFTHKKAHMPRVRHYNEEVKQLRGVKLEIRGNKND